ncbi:MAG: YigZ family protein [Oscillospiraceae bacterium]|nr:YigZ family protein [Oscillospiraceae bacterium]
MKSYLTPDGPGASELVEKRSRFLGLVRPVESEEAARAMIEEVKKKHYDARHNCWCYLFRDGPVRYSDDGEPQGTAGQPMLNVFQAGGVTDLCCVVTRYFGGVLLGAGGLVRAYSAAAKQALDAAGLRRMDQWRSVELDCPYPLYERVRRLLEDRGAATERCDFGAAVSIGALLPEAEAAGFARALGELSAGTVTPREGATVFRGVRVN